MLTEKEHEKLSKLIEAGLNSSAEALRASGTTEFAAKQMQQRVLWIEIEEYPNSLKRPKTSLDRAKDWLGRVL